MQQDRGFHGAGQDWAQPEIDTSVPHYARVYDYWLGGKDNYPADRAAADAIAEQMPTVPFTARANRAFLARAVRYLVREAGIRQFLDIGTGIPTHGNVHEVAQEIAPDTRVVYVDNDPIVLAHARALMASNPAGKTAFVAADARDPEAILTDPALAATLDPTQPVALMLVAILMYFPDTEDPYGIVSTLLGSLPSGSYLTISHLTADFDPPTMARAIDAAERSGITYLPRSCTRVESFFTGLDFVAPGLVPILAWRPDTVGSPAAVRALRTDPEPPTDTLDAPFWAGMARKP